MSVRFILLTTFLWILPLAEATVPACPITPEQSYAYMETRFGIKNPLRSGATDDLKSITTLEFIGLGFSDEDLPALCPFRSLKFLSLSNDPNTTTKIKGAALGNLAALSELEYLDLDGNEIAGEHLQQLSQIKSLRTLKLGLGAKLGNDHMNALDDIPQLSNLVIQGSDLTPADLEWLPRSKKIWEALVLSDNRRLGNAALPLIARAHVRGLDLERTGISSAKGFEALARNEHLRSLALSPLPSKTSFEILRTLAPAPALRVLDMKLPLNSQFTNILTTLPRLEALSLDFPSGQLDEESHFLFNRLLQSGHLKSITLVVQPPAVSNELGSKLCDDLRHHYPSRQFTLVNNLGHRRACAPDADPQ